MHILHAILLLARIRHLTPRFTPEKPDVALRYDRDMRLLPILFASIVAVNTLAATITGRVVGVHDGDTITVLDGGNSQHKIRLAGIDAPELKQAFGNRSKQSLSEMVYNKQVKVEWDKRDRYGRIVGKVLFIPALCVTPGCLEPTDANYQQIAVGMAWYYRQYEKELNAEDRARYDAAENQAREAKRGLWADAKPVPPWEWRRQPMNAKRRGLN